MIMYGEKAPSWSSEKVRRITLVSVSNKCISGLSSISTRIILPGASSLWQIHIHKIEKKYWLRIFAGFNWYLGLVRLGAMLSSLLKLYLIGSYLILMLFWERKCFLRIPACWGFFLIFSVFLFAKYKKKYIHPYIYVYMFMCVCVSLS